MDGPAGLDSGDSKVDARANVTVESQQLHFSFTVLSVAPAAARPLMERVNLAMRRRAYANRLFGQNRTEDA